MNRLKSWGAGLILGVIPPLVGLLAGWWGTFTILPERLVPLAALSGLLVGGVVDLLFLRRWMRRAYSIGLGFWVAVYLFYSLCVFGFFMGVPVFNALLALPAGLFLGCRLAHEGATETHARAVARRTALFTTSVLALVCLASAALALIDPHTATNLEGMLGLRFKVTSGMIVGLIVVGGTALLLVEWWLSRKAVQVAYAWRGKAA